MQDNRRYVVALVAAVGLWAALVYGSPRTSPPIVITSDVSSTRSTSAHGNIAPPLQTTASGGAPATCPGTPPSPDWVCQNGAWQSPGSATQAAGSGGNGAGGCLGVQPGAGWSCVGGAWVEQGATTSTAPQNALNAPSSTSPNVTAPATPSSSPSTRLDNENDGAQCPANPPSPEWICRSGVWAPPAMNVTPPPVPTPSAPATPAPPSTLPPTPSVSDPSSLACAGPAPGPNYACQNGSWMIR